MSSLYSGAGGRDRPHFEPGFISSAFVLCATKILFSFSPPLTAVSAFHTWPMIARVKVFSVSILHFPKGEQKEERGGGGGLSAAGFTEKIVQNCLIPGQISESIQSQAKCYCAPHLAIILCLFHLEEPFPIKVIQPSQYLLQLNLGGITCLDRAGRASSALTCIH